MHENAVGPPRNFEEFIFRPGIGNLVHHIRSAGFAPIIFTNQPDIERGLMSQSDLDRMHAAITETLGITDIRVCPHGRDGICHCRKPLPGMLTDASRDQEVDLSASYVLGDSWKDVEAGRAAGCRTIYLKTRYNADVRADFVISDLGAISQVIQ
jgi:D-glycero-D-manno-heptose 1,7-bisphosphate phosphatase